jgi:endoglucanase
MKKLYLLIFVLNFVVIAQQNPFTRGVNLSNWFQSNSAKAMQFSKYTRENFEQLKSLGVNVVRLPINLHSMTYGPPAYALDSLFLFFLDQVVDWTEELDISLIIDNHTFDVTQSTDPNIDQVLIPVWTQMASHYKNRSDKIYYEILNEPHGISDARWNQIQQAVVTAIRAVDQKHTIIVGPAGWNSYNNLAAMPVYSDTNLIYTFHFYDPFIFTHQGASWTDLDPVSGVPFPYNASRMPVLPPQLAGTWVQTSWNSYPSDGTVQKVYSLLGKAANFQAARNVKLFCGEFGVYIPNSPDADRVYWYEMVRKYLEQYNMSWTTWDYQGGFGLFENYSNELFNHDLNAPLLTALGFNVPPQTDYVKKPDTTQFDIYSDFVGENIKDASYTNGILNFYESENPSDGQFCIYWNGAQRHGAISFDFMPNKDLSVLKNEGYVFNFMIKGNIPFTSFDIRFIDSKTSSSDHPWRIGVKINQSKITLSNEWQNLQIPLNNFYEFGSWDNNTWYNPMGLFDWNDIDRFEIVTEDSSLIFSKLWFDEIKIFNPNISIVADNRMLPNSLELKQNYPNPFNPSTTIRYAINGHQFVTLKVYDALGNEVATLVNEEKGAGEYQVEFNPAASIKNSVSSVYFYRLQAGNYSETRKMILMK